MGSNNERNIFKILVATDNHLGYLEKDPERGNDSFNTFEEILELAVTHNVDFILLGGDLFHENKPSRSTFLRCMELLRKYTFGDKPVCFNFVSDPAENFPHLRNPCVNYQDPNLNISIPIFSIHGNHDDPSGLGQHSPLEMLSISGLVNYFGRVNNLTEITISPLLLTKGNAKLALYGLSSLKDERLFRLFKDEKVQMLRPKEDMEKWCNVLVLHQNHTKHNVTNYIPEEFLDSFLDLVIWGHEHECRLEAKESTHGQFYVTQPGSSVATSLCSGEAVPKQAALLYVNEDNEMRIVGLPLKTVRPFVFEDISLKDEEVLKAMKSKKAQSVEDIVCAKIEELIEKSKKLITGHPRQPQKPLIRLRVEYTIESQMFNVVRFGQMFTENVANSEGIVLFKKFRQERAKRENGALDEELMESVLGTEVSNTTKVEDLVQQYFAEVEDYDNQMHLLSERGIAHAITQFIDKDDRDAINDIFTYQVDRTTKYLTSLQDLDVDNLEEAIEKFHNERMSKKEDIDEAVSFLSNPSRQNGTTLNRSDYSGSDLEMMEDEFSSNVSAAPKRGRGSRGRRPRGVTVSPGRANSSPSNGNDSSNSSSRARGRSRSRGRGRASSSTANLRTQTISESFSRSTRCSQSKGASFYQESDTD